MAGPLKYPPTKNATQKTLGAQLLAGVTAAATLNNVDGLQNASGVFVVDRVDTNGVETTAKREYIGYAGTSGSTLVTLVRNIDGGGTDQDHAIGAIVEFIPDVIWAQAISDALANVVNTTTLALDTTKVADLATAQTLAHKTLSAPNLVVGSDAAGDMYYRVSGASLARLAKGNINEVLQVNASLPSWRAGIVSSSVPQVIDDATVMYLDFSVGNKFFATIVPSGNRAFLATNATVGSMALLRVQYASTASLSLQILSTLASTSLVNWPADTLPVPTATVNRVDLFGLHAINATLTWDAVTISQNL